MGNFADFLFLNLAPPEYVSDIPDLLTKLEEKQQHFDQKAKDWHAQKHLELEIYFQSNHTLWVQIELFVLTFTTDA